MTLKGEIRLLAQTRADLKISVRRAIYDLEGIRLRLYLKKDPQLETLIASIDKTIKDYKFLIRDGRTNAV